MAKDYAAAFYNSRAWRNTQRVFLMQKNYICEACGAAAVIVHHIRHIKPENIHDAEITLNFRNLRALCIPCHNAIHIGGSACAEGVSFDGDGNIIYSPQHKNIPMPENTDCPSFQYPSTSFHMRGGIAGAIAGRRGNER